MMKMNVELLENRLEQASKLTGQEQKTAYSDAYRMALELFPGLKEAADQNVQEMRKGTYVHPTHSRARETFTQVFEQVRFLRAAYDTAVVDPLFARRTDGYFDVDPELGIKYWRNSADTHKGVM
jgi:hypothetical protein